MSSSLKVYLAEKYMSGPKAEAVLIRAESSKKKKKRKADPSSTLANSMVRDEDGGWGDESKDKEDEMDLSEAVIASDRGFKKRTRPPDGEGSGWITVKEGTPPPAADEQPLVVDETPPRAELRGGLMTAEQLRRARRAEEAAEESKEEKAVVQETVYRDSSGRRIDVKTERAEAARRKREREEKEAQKMEWGKGLVQREEEEKRRQELEKQKTTKFARHADDKELNEELKARERWNDPAAAFLTTKKAKGPRNPEYTGPPPPPNRFGIKPGYRWDGVDRSNGFEKKLFQRRNEKSRIQYESHAWSVEDM